MNKYHCIMGGGFLRHRVISPFPVVLIAILAMLLVTACEQSEKQTKKSATAINMPPEPHRELTPAAWKSSKIGTTIQSVKTEANRLLVTLEIPQNTASGRQRAAFNLILPDQTIIQTRVLRYAIGDRVLWDLSTGDTATTSPLATGQDSPADVIPKGYMRQYPIYRLKLTDALVKPFRALSVEERGDVNVQLELSWETSDRPPADATANPVDVDSNPNSPVRGIEALAARLVINPDDLDRFSSDNPGRIQATASQPHDPRTLASGGKNWARIRVNRDGLYRLDRQGLVEAGVLSSGQPLSDLRVFSETRPVDLLLPAGETGTVPGDTMAASIYFYGWKGDTPYSEDRVYWVTADDQAPAATVSPIDPSLTAVKAMPLDRIMRHYRMENNAHMLVEHGNFLSFKGAFWVDRKMLDTRPLILPIRLFKPVPLAAEATLPMKIKFYTYGNPEKWLGTQLNVKVDSTELALLDFTGADRELMRTIHLPVGLLHDGRVNLRLEVVSKTPSTSDSEDNAGIWLDWLEIDYPGKVALKDGVLTLDSDALTTDGLYRLDGLQAGGSEASGTPAASLASLAIDNHTDQIRLLDPVGMAQTALSDGVWTTEIVDLSNLKPAALSSVTWDDSALDWSDPFDYLIITNKAFRDGLEPLLDLNKQRGLKTKVVNVADLYDFFSDGTMSPQAIRDYLGYVAKEAGSQAPDYVLLVGDCTSDYLDETKSGVVNWVPSYSYRYGEDTFASDVWFTMAVGHDAIPDYLLGRLSVNNPEDLASVIKKTVDYATQPVFGPWRARMAYVADNFEQFRRTAVTIESKETPPAFDAREIYLDRMSLEDNWYYPKDELERIWAEERTMMKVSGESTVAIKDTFDQGVAWLDYYGHGAPNLWTDERIWFGGDSPNRDTQHLKANGLYPFIVNFTCNTGAIDYPMPQWNICISEDLMRVKNAGAVGMFVPSGPGQTILHEKLSAHLRRALFQDDLRGFGAVTELARIRYLLEDNNQSLVWMYNLLGDPASQVALPRRWGTLTLDREVAVPGRDTMSVSMEGIWPTVGQALAWVEDDSGKVVWQKEDIECQDGRVRFDCRLPEDLATPENARIYLYVWNEHVERDFVATAVIKAVQPEVLIRQARVVRPEMGSSRVHFEIDLENTGQVDAEGIALSLADLDQPDQPLDERTLSLAIGQSQTVSIDLDVAAQADPMVFDWSLSLPKAPDSTQVANPQHVRIALAGSASGNRILRDMSYWEPSHPQMPNGRIHAVCMSTDAETSAVHHLIWRTASGDVSTSTPIIYAVMSPERQAEIDLRPQNFRQMQADDNVLALVAMDGGTSRKLDEVRLGDLTRYEPRLRIRPGSITHEPEYPTDGQTIYVNFIAENVGQTSSAPTTAQLQSDDSPVGQGSALAAQTSLLDNRVPALAPGRSVPVQLRWDPAKNAGVQNIYINLNPRPNRPDNIIKEQLIVHRIYVKTKSNLVRTRPPWSSASEEDRLADRIWLHVELENMGETDAHNVLVSFYLDKSRSEDKLIGWVDVDQIPAKSKREVKLMWAYDREKVLRNGQFNVRPVVDIRLKGSSQRIAE